MINNTIFTKQLSHEDLDSLKHLGQITNSDKVDIYENGRVSLPYQTGMLASGWRTARYVSGYANNREDIPKIKGLVDRCLFAYMKGDNIREDMEQAIKGLSQLKATYDTEKKELASQSVEEIITYMKNKMSNLQGNEIKPLVSANNAEHFQNLEASVLSDKRGTQEATDGFNYFIDKIEGFVRLNSDVSTQDKSILLEIKKQLLKSVESFDLKNKFPLEFDKNMTMMEFKQKRVELPEMTLNSLDQMEPEARKNIGILIPLSLSYYENKEARRFGDLPESGHAVTVSVCKEEDGTYTVIQCNAGDLSLTNTMSLQLNKKYLLQQPFSVRGKTVVEFGPLTRDEAKAFLNRAYDKSNYKADNKAKYKKSYGEIFAGVLDRKKNARVPDRRFQDIGNCSLRSVKEWIIFSLQKCKKIKLANELQKFATARDSQSLPQEEIKDLIF
jgi:hypothetical protein